MHRLLIMNTTGLAELYWLLQMYQCTYESPAAEDTTCLLNRIQTLYEGQASSTNHPPSLPPKLHNPRGAGRKEHYPERITGLILNLHAAGNSIRAIAYKIPCSVGHVHKIIHEHDQL